MLTVIFLSSLLLSTLTMAGSKNRGRTPADSSDGCRPAEPSLYGQEAFEATTLPVRPGKPGKQPFWNVHAPRFIYAPAFDFATRKEAKSYHLVARSLGDSAQYTANIDQPWLSFPSLWQQLPCDSITLTAAAIGSNGEIIDTVGTRTFMKSPAFNGPYHEPPYSCRESGRKSLQALLHQKRIQHWLEHEKPGNDYWGWANPAKIMGGLISGMIHYATHFPDAEDAAMAKELARIVADFLLTLREPEDHRLANWPLTYWDGVSSGRHPIQPDRIKTNFVINAGMAFLDMYDATREKGYYRAALQIAETFEAVQNDSGTWPQMFDRETGRAAANANQLIPTWVIMFFDRLHRDYGVTRFQTLRQRAFRWCMEKPVKTYGWYAQFLDTPPGKRYKNMSRDEANELAIIILKTKEATPKQLQIALELLRYAEDQFVVWDQRDPVLRTRWFRKGTRFDGLEAQGSDWFVPSVLEQYKFYTPIAGSNAIMIRAYVAACQRAGRPIYRAKAVSLANTLIRAQDYHGGVDIPTHLRRTLIDDDFIDNGINAALVLLEYADILTTRTGVEAK
ncbi:hypothetical protein GF407_03380 [candidate division KSB1 bacterium]|nr:hypothetical protein [candidate division KSB1 bacterium]